MQFSSFLCFTPGQGSDHWILSDSGIGLLVLCFALNAEEAASTDLFPVKAASMQSSSVCIWSDSGFGGLVSRDALSAVKTLPWV